MNTIIFSGNTDMGRKRTNNEDAFIAQCVWNNNHILAAAIDGVGGYEGGEVASAMAQKYIVEYLEKYPNGERSELLKQAVVYANNAIFSARKEMPQYSCMSCVLTAVLVEVDKELIHLAHVGDTRLYQYTSGQIMKLSHDHSLVGYREEIGELTEIEAMNHPQRNIIGRDVGSKYLEGDEQDYIEVATFPLLPNSTLLLCSDGLCDMITSEQMKMQLEKNVTIQEKVVGLIAAANNAGGKDNVTVVLVEYNCPDHENKEIEAFSPQPEPEQLPAEEKPAEPVIQGPEKFSPEELAESKTVSSKYNILYAVILSAMFFVAGYILGGYTGKEHFPGFFSYPVNVDSITSRVHNIVPQIMKSDTINTDNAVVNDSVLPEVPTDSVLPTEPIVE